MIEPTEERPDESAAALPAPSLIRVIPPEERRKRRRDVEELLIRCVSSVAIAASISKKYGVTPRCVWMDMKLCTDRWRRRERRAGNRRLLRVLRTMERATEMAFAAGDYSAVAEIQLKLSKLLGYVAPVVLNLDQRRGVFVSGASEAAAREAASALEAKIAALKRMEPGARRALLLAQGASGAPAPAPGPNGKGNGAAAAPGAPAGGNGAPPLDAPA